MADINASFWRLEEALQRKEQAPQATQMAQVNRIAKDGTVYVVFPESDEEVPLAQATSEAAVGDALPVEVKGGKLYAISGNASDPTLGAVGVRTITEPIQAAASAAFQRAIDAETDAARAKSAADSAVESAGDAEQAAIAAQNSLKSVVQGATTVEKAVSVMQTALEAVVDYDPTTDTTTEYFWHDSAGAHVLGDTSGYRNDIDSTGMDIVEVSTERSAAHFGADGATIGKVYDAQASDNESHLELDYHSLQLIDKDGDPYFHVSDLRDANGEAEITEIFRGTGTRASFSVAFPVSSEVSARDSSNLSNTATRSEKTYTFQSAPSSGAQVTIVYKTQSSEAKAMTFGYRYENSRIGALSAAIGIANTSSGDYSLASGRFSKATGQSSFAAGVMCEASGANAFACGSGTVASGSTSYAEGGSTVASGSTSHAQNQGTIAAAPYQTALGKYNVQDSVGNYAAIIGNGTADNARSNALAVDWNGNVLIAGDVQDMSGNEKYLKPSDSPTKSTSGNATAGTNITLNYCHVATYGKVAQMFASITTTASISAGSTVLTLASGKRPVYEVFVLCANPSIPFYANPSGTVIARNALTNATNYYLQATYLMA